MNLFGFLTLIGGISLFLFGMQLLSQSLEKKAGGRFSALLSRFTANRFRAFLLGTAVTALMQSSSATTVMAVGLVNAGVLTLSQSVGITVGANLGTTVTAWLLSLTALNGETLWVQLLQPKAFVPLLALVGVILYVFVKSTQKKEIGMILLSFAVLMVGMQQAADAVAGIGDLPQVQTLFSALGNPVLGLLAGAALTAVLQSSSVSIGILQAFCMTGNLSLTTVMPILLGQNIGACVPTLAAAIGANREGKRAAIVRLNFNLLSAGLNLALFYSIRHFLPAFGTMQATPVRVAMLHTAANLIAALVFLPMSSLLEKSTFLFALKSNAPEAAPTLLDVRLLHNPALALAQAYRTVCTMANDAVQAFLSALELLNVYSEKQSKQIKQTELMLDLTEDEVSSYLVQLNTRALSEADSRTLAELLRATGEFERISDHAVHLAVYSEQLSHRQRGIEKQTAAELAVLSGAVRETLQLTLDAFCNADLSKALRVEPLEQVVDELTATLRRRQAARSRTAPMEAETEVLFSDLLDVLERASDHCSALAASLIEIQSGAMDIHDYVRSVKADSARFRSLFAQYQEKYAI